MPANKSAISRNDEKMKEAKINCPKCGGHLVFPIELAGQEAPCPHGNESILLPKTKSKTPWIFAAVLVFALVCVGSIVVWKHQAKHDATLPVRVAENTNLQAVVLQKDPLATEQLFGAAQSGDMENIILLLKKGADINAKYTNGATALLFAASAGQRNTVELLLDNGADINAGDTYGKTALMWAAGKGQTNVVMLLLDKGAAINAKENDGATALVFAAALAQTDAIKLLLDKGADINAKEDDGTTALLLAAGAGKMNAVELLLAKGADINARDKAGYTALTWAAQQGHRNVVELLLEKGTDINVKDNAGNTALIWAVMGAHTDVIKLLLDKGADINAKDNDGNSALMLAKVGGHAEVIDLLSRNATGFSEKPAFEVLNVTAKPTEQNDIWWRYGYRLTVRNNGMDNDRQYFEIQFLDAEGYVIDTKPEVSVIKPGATEIITGEALVNLPGAARVAKLKAIWKHY